MTWRGFSRIFGSITLVSVGMAAIATDKIVSEYGTGVIIKPVSTAISHLESFASDGGNRFSAFIEHWLNAENDVGIANATDKVIATHVPAGNYQLDRSEKDREKEAEKLGGAGALALPQAGASNSQNIGMCDQVGGGIDVAVLGDRLALRFFEQSTLAAAPSTNGASRSENIVFERLDLSGSYEVGANGAVSLPAIGHVDVINRSLPCIELLVTRAASERLRLNGSVSAAFASRPPILVRGMVRAPGTHAYSPGLTVERVLAQAGAIERAELLSPLQMAALRARQQELDALAAGLMLERVRIDAALADDIELATNTQAWETLAKTIGADRVKTERGVLLAELAEEKVRNALSSDRIDVLDVRISAAQEHLEVIKSQLAYLAEHYEAVAQRRSQGITTENKVKVAKDRMMAMERTVLERRDVLLNLTAELNLVRQEAAVRRAERRKRLAMAARATAMERSSVREQLNTVQAQLETRDHSDEQTFTVTILRTEPGGIERFIAAPETPVRPGDLVTVAMTRDDSRPVEVPAASEVDLNPSRDLVIPVSSRIAANDTK